MTQTNTKQNKEELEEHALEIVKRVYAGYGDYKKCIDWVKDYLVKMLKNQKRKKLCLKIHNNKS